MYQHNKAISKVHRSNENLLHRAAYAPLERAGFRIRKVVRRELCYLFRRAFNLESRGKLLQADVMERALDSWQRWGKDVVSSVEKNGDTSVEVTHLVAVVNSSGRPGVG
jgi:hypothetical protein